ncbi:hypothetical protein H4R33_004339 [Dimargaris cristalligena]|uniref:HAD-like domain-containing protein n=1 Tax=Dimargaris cristalligena TaxID=215637 RepID=A0A4P9ZVT8_9FUNG|nr:hypothetical protein H4R33_004339 [Dimargaris cristalligena]RKP37756.1 hypothetical protein BJ085DRAFT_33746 [Dimargaris cristalligena]|eukprot:RKP37756.1 hypothetical protein BJ085DRAFT_33746 [Dimargaris cristalligena]
MVPVVKRRAYHHHSITPAAELLVMDFDGTLTGSDTIAVLADLAINQAQSRTDRQANWELIVQAYVADYSQFQARWDVTAPTTNPPSRRTMVDLQRYFVELDHVESRSIERINQLRFFRGLTQRTLLEYGHRSVPMQPQCLTAIRNWLQPTTGTGIVGGRATVGAAIPNGPDGQTGMAPFAPQSSVRRSDFPVEEPTLPPSATPAKRYRDWAILSVNWSCDFILGSLLPMLDLALPSTSPTPTPPSRSPPPSSTTSQELTPALYPPLLSRIHSNNLAYSEEPISCSPFPSSATATGTINAPLRTGLHKLSRLRQIIDSYHLDPDPIGPPPLIDQSLEGGEATLISSPTGGERLNISTIYVGDSINDLPCLLEADIGILIGHNATVTQWCADLGIVIHDGLPQRVQVVPHTQRARRTRSRERHSTLRHQNCGLPDSSAGWSPIYRITHWEQFAAWYTH